MNDEHIYSSLDFDPANPHGIGRFRMEHPDHYDLQNFLRKHARKSVRSSLARTYVACRADAPTVAVGYVSLLCAQVSLDGAYLNAEKPGADRYPAYPAVKIARLAVSDNAQRKGVGRGLLDLAMGVTLAQIRPHVGCRFVILDALAGSVDFYRRNGFTLLDTEENRRSPMQVMFLDLGQSA